MKRDIYKPKGPYYPIGTWVAFHFEMVRGRHTVQLSGAFEYHPYWKEAPTGKELQGQITGIARRHDGIYRKGGVSCSIDGYFDEPGYLQITKTHYFYLVRVSLVGKEYLVPMDKVTPTTPQRMPFKSGFIYPWSEKDRQRLRADSKTWPRDEKGRWTS